MMVKIEKLKNFFGFSIMFLIVFKYYSTYFGLSNLNKYVILGSLFFATILIFSDLKNYNLIHILILGIFGVQFVLSKNITMVYAYYLCLGLIQLEFRDIIKYFLIFCIIFFSIFMVTNVMGMHPTEYLEGRNDFGFGNPNTAFISMFMVWSAFFFYIFNRGKNIDFILMLLMVFLMYTQTMTRTGLLTAVGTLVAFIILRLVDVRKKYIKILISLFPIMMTGLTMVITVFLSNNYLINKVLSHRPVYWNTYIMHPSKGVNLFGYAPNIRDILFTQRMPLDSGYVWSLYSLGIVAFVILILLYTYAIYNMCIENKKDEILLITSILIYCFAESIMIDLATNISLILVVYGISKMKAPKLEFLYKRSTMSHE